jgi:DNA-binding SARP family transcriptional activator
VAWVQLQQILSEQEIRVKTIRGLLAALDEQQSRLGAEVKAAMDTLGVGAEAAVTPSAVRDAPRLPNKKSLVVHCLGGLEVFVDGVPIASWRSGKARAVFEYLVNHRHRPVPRDTLIQALWPDPDALAASTSLKVAVHALRQIFSEYDRAGLSPKLTVVVHEASYQIIAPVIWLDVEEFERCCSRASQLEASGHAEDALTVYESALELYKGEFLPESFDDWVVFRREGLKDQNLLVLAKLAAAKLQAGDYQRCIELCRQLIEQDCCREDTFRMLMVCHALLGQRGRVRRWYDLCVRTLRTTLDTDPEAETLQVYEWARRRAREPPPRAASLTGLTGR